MRRFWIVVLLVALLPLRGWAALGAEPAPGALPPCHTAAEVEAHAAAIDADSAPSAACACDLCALCHSPAIAAPSLASAAAAADAAPPRLAARDTGRQLPERLEKPPRSARA